MSPWVPAFAGTSGTDAATAGEIAAALAALERQAGRLTVSHRNPEKFHEDKSELVEGLARLRRLFEGQ
jgi:precorrin-6B methylase 2